LQRCLIFILAAGVIAGAIVCLAQTSNPPAASRAAGPGVVQVNPRPAQNGPDLFDMMVSSAASLDLDSPVEVRAEFDPPTVALGARATYRVVLTALDESVKLPDQLPAPPGLDLRPGGRGQTYLPIGGQRMRPQTTINFHATAASTGTFVMPSFTMTAYSKTVIVPEARLTVVPASVPGTREEPRLFVQLPDGDIFAGQTIKVSVALPDSPDGSAQGLLQPRMTGEHIFQEQSFSGQRHETFRRNGQAYAALVQDLTITPMREGSQELVAQANTLSLRSNPGQPGVFQSFSLIDSDPVTLTVKPLPKQGRLPGFTGAIGSFQIEPPKLSTNLLRAGDPVTLTVTVRGDGNLGRLSPPPIPLLRDWQAFQPISDAVPPYGVQQRTFNYTLIPLTDRIKSTPTIPFACFDPVKKTYVDITIPPVPVTVKPLPRGAMAKTESARPDNSNLEDEETSGPDRELFLTGLAETPGLPVGSLTPVQRRGWFLALQLLPAAGLAGIWLWDRRRRYLELHPEVIRKRRARRGIHRELRLARRAAATRDAAGFASRAINALREACAPREAANPQALVCADVLEELAANEQVGRHGEVVRRLFVAADAARFGGPVRDGQELLALKPELERLLDELKARL
jgi:hypothetical protein